MKYFLLSLLLLTLSACQAQIPPKNIESPQIEIEKTPEIKTPINADPNIPSETEVTTEPISKENRFIISQYDSINSWKNFPWKQEIAIKKDKNIKDYFYLADTNLFCDSTSDDTESQNAFDKQVVIEDTKNDYILAHNSIGDEVQFTRFKNTKGGKDIFISRVNVQAGSMCGNFNILEWHDNSGWKEIKLSYIFPQKEIENLEIHQSNEEMSEYYVLPQFGTTIEVYPSPMDEEQPPLAEATYKLKRVYSLTWNGATFDLK